MATSSTENLTISNWIKLTSLGRGSFGDVFLGIPTKPNLTCVAIKVAPCRNATSIFREKTILKSFVGHPEIIQCIGQGVTEERNSHYYNLVLEYAAGGTLAGLIKQRNKLPEEEAKEYLRMILRGLSYIHEKGFVHSDLKPTNILAFPAGQDGRMKLKIADFGLSKRYENNEKEEQRQCCELRFRGTPRYMSPESLSGEIKPPLDIWSLGCVLINMVTGEIMWNDCIDNRELISKLRRKKIPNIPKELSLRGKDFLRKCFERNPRRRWSADMLLRHPYLAEEPTENHRFSFLRTWCFVGSS